MAITAEEVVVILDAKVDAFNAKTDAALKQFDSKMGRVSQSAKRTEAQVLRSSTAINRALTTIGSALGIREITQYADAWTSANNMLRSSATAAGVSVRSLNELKTGANEARTELSTYVDLYARLIRSASGVAKSEEEVALATSLVAKAMKAGGAAISEQQAAILQLGQALGSGVLQGDELRSLRENAPIVAKAIADEFGVTIAGLKKLGEEGKLVSDRVFRAIINAQRPIEAQFKATNATIRDSITQLNNEFTAYIGNADASAGASRMLVEALQYLANNFREVADVVVQFATVVGAALLGRSIAGVVVTLGSAVAALGTFITALRTGTVVAAGFSAALGPIGLLAGAAAGAILLLYNNISSGDKAAKAFSNAIGQNETALLGAASASKQYQSELVKQIKLQLEAAKASEAQAQADFEAALSRGQMFRDITGVNFKPFDSMISDADRQLSSIQTNISKLEEQQKRAEEIFNSSPSGYGGGVGSGGGGSGKKGRLNEFEREIKQIQERTQLIMSEVEAQRQLNPLVNDYGYAVEFAMTKQELLNAAKAAGVTVTPQLAAQIDNLAHTYATAAAESDRLREAQDKLKEQAQEVVDALRDSTQGLVQDLLDGKDASEAFANALKKMANVLLSQAFDGLFNGTGSTGGGGLLGGLFKLFGFAEGGYTGSGGKYDAAGVVHKGEYVFDQKSVQRAGGPAAMATLHRHLKGYADGGFVGTAPTRVGGSRSYVDQRSYQIDARGAQRGVGEEIREALEAYDKQLPYRIQEIDSDPRAR